MAGVFSRAKVTKVTGATCRLKLRTGINDGKSRADEPLRLVEQVESYFASRGANVRYGWKADIQTPQLLL